jgi:hypothetical protein
MFRSSKSTTTPGFIADPGSERRSLGRQIDWSRVDESYRATPGTAPVQVKLTAGAAQAATALVVTALTGAVPAGTVLRFSADEFATTTALAAKGATNVPVEALVNALETNDTATYAGVAGSGPKVLPAGKLLAIDAGTLKAYPAIDNTAKEVLRTHASEDSRSDALTGYGTLEGGGLYENLLPDADPTTGLLPAAAKTALGVLFTWSRYRDSRLPA